MRVRPPPCCGAQGISRAAGGQGYLPSETISANYIHQPGVAKLKSWAAGPGYRLHCPPITRYRWTSAASLLKALPLRTRVWRKPIAPGASYSTRYWLMRRGSGAELREGFVVDEFTKMRPRHRGRGHAKGGASVTERARIVVGADGRCSTLAPAVQAPMYNIPLLIPAPTHYWSDVPVEGMEFYPRDGKAVLLLPTNDGLTAIGVGWRSEQFEETRLDFEGHYHRAIESIPTLAKRVREACRMGRILGVPPLPNFFRKPYGPGWALVGDAGYQKDPWRGRDN